MINKAYIIGAGGVGAWLALCLSKLLPAQRLHIVDGDRLESRNLDRQLFSQNEIGQFKAQALAARLGCGFSNTYFPGAMPHVEVGDLLFCCADNNPARTACLRAADEEACAVIIAANETTSAEAYYYETAWLDSPMDPRVYYPELVNDHSGDPRAAAIGCTGLAQEQNVQLASANFMAAALAIQLYTIWFIERPRLIPSTWPSLPHRLRSNLTKLETFRSCDTPEPVIA